MSKGKEIDLRLGDCLEIMKEIPDNSIDMIFADLPYNETGNSWDFIINPQELWSNYERLIKDDGAIVLTGTFKFGCQLYNQAPHLYKYDWVWQKDNGTNVPNVNMQPFRVHEQVFIFGKGRVTNGKRIAMKYFPQKTKGNPYSQKRGSCSKNWKENTEKGNLKNLITVNISGDRHPLTVQFFKRDKNKLHPTQKPVSLVELMIKSYTKKGDIVLDNCMGSGTTGVACKNLGRKFIGIEKDPTCFEIAKNRIKGELVK